MEKNNNYTNRESNQNDIGIIIKNLVSIFKILENSIITKLKEDIIDIIKNHIDDGTQKIINYLNNSDLKQKLDDLIGSVEALETNQKEIIKRLNNLESRLINIERKEILKKLEPILNNLPSEIHNPRTYDDYINFKLTIDGLRYIQIPISKLVTDNSILNYIENSMKIPVNSLFVLLPYNNTDNIISNKDKYGKFFSIYLKPQSDKLYYHIIRTPAIVKLGPSGELELILKGEIVEDI